MNPGLLGLAVVVVAGGVVAASARDPRLVVGGLVAVVAAAAILGADAGASLPIAARLVGAGLALYLLRVATRGGAETRGSGLGLPSEALLAGAAAVAGVAATAALAGPDGAAAVAAGPAAERTARLGAAFGLAALAVGPVMFGRDALRLVVGILLAVEAAILVRAGLLGPPTALEQVALAVVVAALGAGGAALAAIAVRSGGGLSLEPLRRVGAHPAGGGAGAGPVGPRSAGARRTRRA